MSLDDDLDDASNPDQGSESWHAERAGCITASRMGDLIWTPGQVFKSGPRKGQPKPPPDGRNTYINQIVAELLTGQAIDQVRARQLDYGHEMEPFAVSAYEGKTGQLVEQCGFLRHPNYPFIGASPDFLVDENGGGEIKCPMSIVVHAATLRDGLPDEHIEQIQGGLWVTGRAWWDFVSFNPRFPPGLDLYVQRVHRDDARISIMKQCCLSAWDEVQSIVAKLRQKEVSP